MASQIVFHPPLLHRPAHVSTILPNRLRRVNHVSYQRKSFDTPDGDFFDVDCILQQSSSAVILLHGLEGSSESTYMLGMAKVIAARGWDVLALNHRSCSGRANRLYGSYHSGFTNDLEFLLGSILDYKQIALVGFSLGGNIALKYLGQAAQNVDPRIRCSVGISVPMHLSSAGEKLSKGFNRVYLQRFLRQLKRKALEKASRFPEQNLDIAKLKRASNFEEFDELYTAPAHGFANAADYYTQSSSRQFLSGIMLPTLLIHAQNDTFLSPECYPHAEVKSNACLHMLTPTLGGHVGFAQDTFMRHPFWHEERTIDFLDRYLMREA